ncbi:hypothetical protein FNV43_RR20074 [Rhamnella rubrinervis]|uniref:Uncharacterized protein n=1 Tax=Rhamnella rubrinervis TaxID=2594499 RepID=A0A8K0GTV3_9ROSA|nr:hypothetical protein FNV43_RR20074 [Rhamnella rubrinervis]
MIVKLSFLAVASFATFAVSRINTRPTTRNQNSAANPPDNVSNFQQQQSEKEDEDELANSNAQKDEEDEAKKLNGRNKVLNNVKEREKLLKELEERKKILEGKLLVLHNFQEKQPSKTQLQVQLEEKLSEIEMLKVSLASLQSERKNLKDEVKQSILAKKQLEMAKKTIVEMQQNMDVQTRHIKGQLLTIGGKVCGFQNNEISDRDFLLEKKLREVKNVELEVVQLKRKNKEIELEKRELSLRLFVSQAKITSICNITEGKIVAKFEEEKTMLRQANADLLRQAEILQKNRFDLVQELVYQRWLQSCLRFEIQNKSDPPRQTPLNPKLNSIPCPNSHVEIEPLVSDSSSSYTSSTDHSDEVDTITIESSSSSQKSREKSPFLMHTAERWRKRSKDDKSGNSLSNTDEIHSFSSTSTSPSMKKNELDFTDDQASKPFPRVRRVSFNDLDKSDKPKSDEKEIIGGDQRACRYSSSTSMNSSSCFKYNRASFEGNEHDPVAILTESHLEPINGGGSKIEVDIISSKKMSQPSMQASDQLSDKENRVVVVETHMFNFVAALLFFFLFLLLSYVLHIHKV